MNSIKKILFLSLCTFFSSLSQAATVGHPTVIAAPVVEDAEDIDKTRLGRSIVTIGPYTGLPFAFDGSELIVNTPGINTDVSLLKIRQSHETIVDTSPRDYFRPHLVFSGALEGRGKYRHHATGRGMSDIDLTNAELDGLLETAAWVSGFFSFNYDKETEENSFNRVANSNVFLDRAFVTVGNLTVSPFYWSAGQLYVPFGAFSTHMITKPFVKAIGRIKTRAVVLGWYPSGEKALYGALFAFKGDSYARSKNNINNGGANIAYRVSQKKWNTVIGASYVLNLAEAAGMQSTDGTGFSGFGSGSGTPEKLSHRVPAADIYTKLNIDNIHLLAELTSVTTHFSASDLTFNNHTAKPLAWNIEAAYSLDDLQYPSAVAIGYSRTKEALALNLPKDRIAASFNTSIWKHTIESLEIRHDGLYNTHDTGTGHGVAVSMPGLGHSDTAVTAQIDLYF